MSLNAMMLKTLSSILKKLFAMLIIIWVRYATSICINITMGTKYMFTRYMAVLAQHHSTMASYLVNPIEMVYS